MRNHKNLYVIVLLAVTLFPGLGIKTEARNAATPGASQSTQVADLRVGANSIGGVVSGSNGPEAGVWVIAETSDLPTTFRKIVVTDDRGQFIVPDLPKANYKVWVRGYGLLDSKAVEAALGKKVKLEVVPAPTPRAAAEVYPANYWYSLLRVPPESDFPMASAAGPSHVDASFLQGGPRNQAEWVYAIRLCTQCHQLGDKSTREIEGSLGKFDSSAQAWDRRLWSGQMGIRMRTALLQVPPKKAIGMLSDWTDRIANGAVPPAPPRPQGVERNIVVTQWNWSSMPSGWVHDVSATDKRNPTVNAHGIIYGGAEGNGMLVTLDPNTNTAGAIKTPTRDASVELDPDSPYRQAPEMAQPSPYYGDRVIWSDPSTPHNPMFDETGRVWLTSAIRGDNNPAFCKDGQKNPFAQMYPLSESHKQLSVYDPETKKWKFIDTCFTTHHLQFAYGKGDILYLNGEVGAGGWVDTSVYDKTGDSKAAQGWCPLYWDVKGDGKFDPKTDKIVPGFPYSVAVDPVDGSAWYATMGVPGNLVRIERGSSPPATCRSEVYEPPYGSSISPDKTGFGPHGVDIGSDGIVWVTLYASGQLARFDRSKCAVRTGPTATGQQCPDAWKLYRVPGPLLGGTELGSTDHLYYGFVNQFNTFGLGKNVPIVTGSNSDSLMALLPETGKWVVIRVPYPLGFWSRGMDGRIDDPNDGWKGRGLWATNSQIPIWHMEGGVKASPTVMHFQLRPDPLAQ